MVSKQIVPVIYGGETMRMAISMAAIASLVAGCGNAPVSLALASPAELVSVPEEDLLYACGLNGDSTIVEEVRRRFSLTQEELAAIADRRIFVGMHYAAMRCAVPVAA